MTMSTGRNIIVIGGGSWGAALAHQLRMDRRVHCRILARSAQTKERLEAGIIAQLPEITGIEPFEVTTDNGCLCEADIIYLVIPVSGHATMLAQISEMTATNIPVVLCAKGLVADEQRGGVFLHEYIEAVCPGRPFGVLSGPSFADEVLKGLPTALLAASTSPQLAAGISEQFTASQLRLYKGGDCAGAAIGGAVKNVMAIAAGICTGQQLGDNARAGLITRGLAEISRLAERLGAARQTISGLAGLGDLILSCNSDHSRNMAYGLALGAGQPVADRLAEGRHSAGHLAARAVYEQVEMPICAAVDQIVNHGAPIGATIAGLLARHAGTE